jgi:hypothetical protein
MQVWAEPFTTLRMAKLFNLFQDPYERADITSNTYWDWHLNHVGNMYGVTADVLDFIASFRDYPPRSFPPSFNPAEMMEESMQLLKIKEMLKHGVDPERVRGKLLELLKEPQP